MTDATVTIPNFQLQLTVEQLVAAVRQLDPEARTELARALAQTELDADLARLIAELYKRPEVTDISDDEIQAEVNAVRKGHRRA